MVIRELLEISKGRLKDIQYIDPIKESVYILSKVLNRDKSFIYTNLDKKISKEEEKTFLSIVDRRAMGEPMSYIFKEKEFMGINFFIERGVLIPRPETEMLVEYIIAYIQKSFNKRQVNILDMGVGSGAIALSIGKFCKNSKALGVDISKRAIEVSNKNLDRLNLSNVSFRKSNLFENIRDDEKFNIIVSNPPYIEKRIIDNLQLDVRKFEPNLALDGGEDGLFFYKKISKESKKFLLERGLLVYEIGFDQGISVKEILEKEGFKDIKVIKDLQGHDRIIMGFKE